MIEFYTGICSSTFLKTIYFKERFGTNNEINKEWENEARNISLKSSVNPKKFVKHSIQLIVACTRMNIAQKKFYYKKGIYG